MGAGEVERKGGRSRNDAVESRIQNPERRRSDVRLLGVDGLPYGLGGFQVNEASLRD
jgi:hypothetical protein